ncbi:hypothetical protein AAY473_013878 [Plecturocebus cupreus]
MGLGCRRGGQRLGTPARARPPRGRLRAQAGAPRPPRAEVAAGPAPRLKGRRLTGPPLRGPGGRLRGEARGPALSSPPQPTRPLPPPPRASLLAPAPEPPASTALPPPTSSPNAPEVASAGRPYCAAAGLRRWNRTNPESSGASGGSGQRAGPHLTAPTGPAFWSRPSGHAPSVHRRSVHAGRQPSWLLVKVAARTSQGHKFPVHIQQKRAPFAQVQWLTPITPTLWEAEAQGRQRRESVTAGEHVEEIQRPTVTTAKHEKCLELCRRITQTGRFPAEETHGSPARLFWLVRLFCRRPSAALPGAEYTDGQARLVPSPQGKQQLEALRTESFTASTANPGRSGSVGNEHPPKEN